MDGAKTEKAAPVAASAELDEAELRRYARHLILPEVGEAGQRRLKSASVLLVGAGGLGSPLGLYLAAAGVGTLGLVDDDRVELSNLHRQVLYGQRDLGAAKTEAAASRLQDINPHIVVRPHSLRLGADNVEQLIAAYDVVADGSDNASTRFLVNDACARAGKPDVWGAVQRFEGQVSVFWGGQGPCYRCLFPALPPPGLIPSCAEGGVLGVLPGIVGALQAAEVLKLLLGAGDPLIGRLLIFDALRMRFRTTRLSVSEACAVCSGAPVRQRAISAIPPACRAGAETTDEVASEESRTVAPDPDNPPFEITVHDLKSWLDEGRPVTILDVREPQEHALCRLEGARLIPLGQLAERRGEIDATALVVAQCHHGGRSAQATMFLRQQGFRRVTNLGGGIDAWSREIDPSLPRY